MACFNTHGSVSWLAFNETIQENKNIYIPKTTEYANNFFLFLKYLNTQDKNLILSLTLPVKIMY